MSVRELARRFPAGFRFGVGDSDLQVIGEAASRRLERSRETMWHHYAIHSGKVFNEDTPDLGVDRLRRWQEDVDLIAGLGFRHYRTSISWSRLIRNDGSPNPAAVHWYADFFRALRERGIRTYATLYHWELPVELHLRGGWKNRATVQSFVHHATTAVRELGEWIDEWFLLNEPWCAAHNSFYFGVHAPGETDLAATLLAAHHLLLAQARAFIALKEIDPHLPVGTVYNIEPAFPLTDSQEDADAARTAHEFFNAWFLDPLYLGRYPEFISARYGDAVPDVPRSEMESLRIGPQLHALGINYYQSKIVTAAPDARLGYAEVRRPGETVNGLGWSVSVPPVYPPGLRLGLRRLVDDYGPHGLDRLLITENGYAGDAPLDPATGGVNDDARIAYHAAHLEQVADAIDDGVPVDGYFAWTLMDNYEWAEGYRDPSRFGLVHIDRENDLRRIPKRSAHWFRELLQSRADSR